MEGAMRTLQWVPGAEDAVADVKLLAANDASSEERALCERLTAWDRKFVKACCRISAVS